MKDINDFSLDAVLADWHSNERDISMCENAIANNWTTVAAPHRVLSECYRMKPLIEKKIEEAGGTVPVTDARKIEQLTARVAELEAELKDKNARIAELREWNANLRQAVQTYSRREVDLENDPNRITHDNDTEWMNA